MKDENKTRIILAFCAFFALSGAMFLTVAFVGHGHFGNRVAILIPQIVIYVVVAIVVLSLLARFLPKRGLIALNGRRLIRYLLKPVTDPVHAFPDVTTSHPGRVAGKKLEAQIEKRFGLKVIPLEGPLSYTVESAGPLSSEGARREFSEYLIRKVVEHYQADQFNEYIPLKLQSTPYTTENTMMYLYDIIQRVRKGLRELVDTSTNKAAACLREFINTGKAMILLISPSIQLQEYLIDAGCGHWCMKVDMLGNIAQLQLPLVGEHT